MSLRSTLATGNGSASGAHVAGPPEATRRDTEMGDRVDALIAQMTLAEKTKQLTQYFYFDLQSSEEDQSVDAPRQR